MDHGTHKEAKPSRDGLPSTCSVKGKRANDPGAPKLSPVAPTPAIDVRHDPALGALREVVGKVVGSVFYATLLKQMRNSPLRAEVGHGGHGEKVFEAQLDAELAGRAGVAGQGDVAAALLGRLADQQLRVNRAGHGSVNGVNAGESTRGAQPTGDPS